LKKSTWTSESSNPETASFFVTQRPATVNEWHVAPRRQYVINLSGQSEIEIGDGTKRRFGPGDIFLADDTPGGAIYRES
jgi:quercetin dioxygenase-like cupin family protein